MRPETKTASTASPAPADGQRVLDASGSLAANRAYYDSFAATYEAQRGSNQPGGYHELVDELETEFVRRFGTNKEVLEVGCGTGLVLSRIRGFASRAAGVDLSPAMLAHARRRNLEVYEGSATALPFPDATFDVTCAFKVLAHIPELARALAEMARVTRPDGTVLAEFYNPYSLRGALKRWGRARAITAVTHEGHVYTRYDAPWRVRASLPAGCRPIASRGVRIVTVSAELLKYGVTRPVFTKLERALCDSPLKYLAGFFIVACRKDGTPAVR